MENNLLTHTKHETTHFDVLSDKRKTVKFSFLPFAGKINVKLNLSFMKVLFGFSRYIQISLVCLKSVKINLIYKAVLEAMIQGSN